MVIPTIFPDVKLFRRECPSFLEIPMGLQLLLPRQNHHVDQTFRKTSEKNKAAISTKTTSGRNDSIPNRPIAVDVATISYRQTP
ncbi:hypothetical protein J5J10_04745 [Ciceribacter sp. L1K23]|uniref:hypothetical protein n=1 Tax=Ciceribacter sp. L1K23 TaxID=2820276 RepID=UPI001B812F5F|nr:hypothetical protein [Ciceribacter sp. L1K23]MBR0554983.1 hypothetical protein [Ciceribacter sp. L1K23]